MRYDLNSAFANIACQIRNGVKLGILSKKVCRNEMRLNEMHTTLQLTFLPYLYHTSTYLFRKQNGVLSRYLEYKRK